MTAAPTAGRRTAHRWLLAGALLTGLLARAPGIYWGHNFPSPSGFGAHHPDEWTHLVLTEPFIDPSGDARWQQNYPKGLAAMTAVPIVAWRTVTGQLGTPVPPSRQIITVGRVLAVLAGVATILIVFLLGRRLTGDARVGLAAAWFLALGGLHVTQSHFFVADVPALFFTMLGLLLLVTDLDRTEPGRDEALRWAAASFGVAFGLKLFVAGLPSLALVTLVRPGRIRRGAHAAVFFVAGFVAVNLGMFTPLDLVGVLRGGMNDPYVYNRWMGLVIYTLEAPAILGLPLLAFALAGTGLVLKRLAAGGFERRTFLPLAVVALPILVHGWNVAFDLDVFPRHTLTLIPFAAMVAGYALVRASVALSGRRGLRLAIGIAVGTWMAVFVIDGERGFIDEPRNEAYRWLDRNVPAGTNIWWYYHNLDRYPQMRFPRGGRPPFLVVEMIQANHILSGVGLRDSYPRDYHNVFDVQSQEEVDQVQALFRGDTEYREVARFREGYWMPEFRLADHWLGNRSRNYLTEIAIFRREGG